MKASVYRQRLETNDRTVGLLRGRLTALRLRGQSSRGSFLRPTLPPLNRECSVRAYQGFFPTVWNPMISFSTVSSWQMIFIMGSRPISSRKEVWAKPSELRLLPLLSFPGHYHVLDIPTLWTAGTTLVHFISTILSISSSPIHWASTVFQELSYARQASNDRFVLMDFIGEMEVHQIIPEIYKHKLR